MQYKCRLDEVMYTPRTLEKALKKAEKQFPVISGGGGSQVLACGSDSIMALFQIEWVSSIC